MFNYKKVIISILLIVCMLVSSLPVFASEPGGVSGVWYAPRGGTWTVNHSIPSSGYLRPEKIVYISYDELVLMQANKLTANDLSGFGNILRDKGIEFGLKWLAKKFGQKVVDKFIPYVTNAVLAYDIFTAAAEYITNEAFTKAINKKHGVAITYGFVYNPNNVLPYKVIDDWTSSYVYNPSGTVGTFAAN